MDPDATLGSIIDLAVAGDSLQLAYAVQDLHDWLADGGYPPKDPRKPSDAS